MGGEEGRKQRPETIYLKRHKAKKADREHSVAAVQKEFTLVIKYKHHHIPTTAKEETKFTSGTGTDWERNRRIQDAQRALETQALCLLRTSRAALVGGGQKAVEGRERAGVARFSAPVSCCSKDEEERRARTRTLARPGRIQEEEGS